MTGGLTSALCLLFSEHQFVATPYIGNDSVLREQLAIAEVWLFSGPEEQQIEILKELSNSSLRTVRFPELYFNAFHPDQVYAWMLDRSLVEGATGPYNSAVTLWAWKHKLTANQAIGLMTPEVFQALGYHDLSSIHAYT
jgi:hypothetical protein